MAPYKIRKNWSYEEVNSLSELQSKLSSEYKQCHVTLYVATPRGTYQTHFVSVDETGCVCYSYGDEQPFDFEQIAVHH